MRFFTALLFTATLASAQQVGVSGGPSVTSGSNAVENSNVNQGWQSDSSLFASSGQPSFIDGVTNSKFANINFNSAVKNNILNNPSEVHVSGNSGWTANGDGNGLGPVQNGLPAGFFKRGGDVTFANNFATQNTLATNFGYPAFAGVAVPRYAYPSYPLRPYIPVARYAAPIRVAHPVYAPQVVPVVQPLREESSQKATIIQNKIN